MKATLLWLLVVVCVFVGGGSCGCDSVFVREGGKRRHGRIRTASMKSLSPLKVDRRTVFFFPCHLSLPGGLYFLINPVRPNASPAFREARVHTLKYLNASRNSW